MHNSTAPKPYTNALGNMRPGPRGLYLVIDTSDGDFVVGTFRNRVLAERAAEASPTYRVREYSLGE